MKGKNVFITGLPRSGKSTLVERVLEELGVETGGMRTPEIREKGRRTGFAVLDVRCGRRGVLASVGRGRGPRLGRYYVHLGELEAVGVRAIMEALDDEKVKLVVIDEIGKMELFSEKFKDAVDRCLSSRKPVLAVLHRDYVSSFSDKGVVFHLNEGNFHVVKMKILRLLRNTINQGSL